MQSSPSLSAKLTALAVFILASGVAASAQTPQDRNSDVPSFKKDNPVVAEPVKPIAPPSPVIVLDASRPVPLTAQVIPPPPRLVKQSAGSVAVPGRSTGGFRATQASASSPLQVNSSFGPRSGRRHNGIDFQASWGEAVGVSMAGTVEFAGIKRGYGNLIIVDHGDGISTYYAHLSAIYVGVGQTVTASQVIGAVGSTGRSSGPHLHYEVRLDGRPVNPNATISVVDGEYYVNGEPVSSGENAEPAMLEGTSHLVAPADEEESRPRRASNRQ